ncbi:MAG TPA: hypothetical protein VK196_08335 [Magnetospirillum sp.]|nr:hypothetical protein [Magnetospirillum sp.]
MARRRFGAGAVIVLGLALSVLSVPRLVAAIAAQDLGTGAAAPAVAVDEAQLSRSPMHPGAWFALAQRRFAEGDAPSSRAALRLSFLSGAVEPALMIPRLRLAFVLMPGMSADDKAILERQVRLTYILQPTRAVRLAAESPVNGAVFDRVVAALNEADYQHIIRIHALH